MEAPLHQSPVPPPPPLQARAMVDAQIKPPPPPAMVGREQCPRCASRDTKFCYYNNYNTAQPRHFCRACRRYWTLGGSLRNVPVGGSTRKRPRPARPTRAIAAAAAASSASPFFASSPVAAPAASLAPPPPTASLQGGILGSLLLGPVPQPLALGAAPLLQGRLAGLGLGQPDQLLLPGASDLAQLGFGAGPLLWPAAATVLEGDRAFPLPPPASLWQELAAAAPPVEAGGLHRGCSPHLLL